MKLVREKSLIVQREYWILTMLLNIIIVIIINITIIIIIIIEEIEIFTKRVYFATHCVFDTTKL